MKTIEQLLFLNKNPHYRFTNDEVAVLDDFLLKKQEKELKRQQKKSLRSSGKNIPVRVRNIVNKVDTYAPEAPESSPEEIQRLKR